MHLKALMGISWCLKEHGHHMFSPESKLCNALKARIVTESLTANPEKSPELSMAASVVNFLFPPKGLSLLMPASHVIHHLSTE